MSEAVPPAEDPLRQDQAVRKAAEDLLWERRGDPAAHAERVSRGKWRAARHQKLISHAVVDLLRGGGGLLIVEIPIREGKSEFCSRRVPTWFLDEFPERQVMLATYQADFAASWGRKVRNDILEYQDQLRVRLSFDSLAADDWRTTAGGGMCTAGVGGAFTGKGGHLVVFDDPYKNAEEALSAAHRESVWDFWRSTLRTRFEPGAVGILPMARWHEDDVSGRLQREPGGDRVVVIRLPGLAEENDPLGRKPGEALWPERFNEKALAELRKSMGEYWFSALVQQRPIPREGGLFRKLPEQQFVRSVPRDGRGRPLGRSVRYWDKAASAPKRGSDPDWTAGPKLRRVDGPDGKIRAIYVEDVRRMRGEPGAVEDLVVGTAEKDGIEVRIRMEQEPGSSGKESIAHYRKLLAAFAFEGVRVTGPKEVRAEAFAGQWNAGNVFVVRTGDPVRDAWIGPFLEELEQFPRGAKDDQVDGAVGAYQDLAGKGPVFASGFAGAGDADERSEPGVGGLRDFQDRPVGGAA